MPQVNMSQALSSPSYAKSLWIDYYKNGNTKGITAAQIGQIEAQWQGKLASWKASTATDDNKYIIDDTSWDNAVEEGKQEARDLTGYKGTTAQKVGQAVNVGKDAAIAGGQAVARTFAHEALREAGKKVATKMTEKAVEKTIEKAGENAVKNLVKETGKEAAKKVAQEGGNKAAQKAAQKAAEAGITETAKEAAKETGKKAATEASQEAAKKAGEKAGVLVGCAFDVASAAIYRISKPNKTQHEAVMEVNEDLPNQQEKTMETSDYMDTMDDELTAYTDDANLHVEDANETMAGSKTDYDVYKQFIENVEHRKTAGETIDKETADMYKEAVEHMTESSENVQMTQEEGTEAVNEIYGTMGEYEEKYGESAEDIANVQGVTDYAENIDESTQMMCNIEGGVQTLDGALATYDAGRAAWTAKDLYMIPYGAGVPMAIVYTAAAVGAVGAAASDGFAAKDQFTWASEIGGEIENRKATQEMNDVSMANYNEKIDNFASDIEDVEGLEMEVPDDVEAPEGEVPAVAPAEQEKSTENTEDKEDDKVKETKNKKNTK